MRMILVLVFIGLSLQAIAGRSGPTKIAALVVKPNWIEFYTSESGGCGTNTQRWHLKNDHPSYNQLYSGLLASKTADLKIDVVGNNTCGVAEDVDWAYVAIDS